MESDDLLIEDYEISTRAIFGILLAFGVASIIFFSICFIYGFVYLLFSLIDLI